MMNKNSTPKLTPLGKGSQASVFMFEENGTKYALK